MLRLGPFVVLAATLVAGVAVGGCSPGHLPAAPPPPTTSKTPPSTPPSTKAPGTTAPATTVTSVPPGVTTPQQGTAFDTNAAVNFVVGPAPANWNVHAAGASAWQTTLEEVLAQVWPSAFYTAPSGAMVPNPALIVSASLVSTDPQTVVYQLNPKAAWSDGVPVTYTDFVYNWEAQCGCGRARDRGAIPFEPAGTAGYSDISNVSGAPSAPDTVKVTFSHPYSDWRSLFAYLVPAHVAEKVGFNSGFTDPVADLPSAGPFSVAEYQPGYSLTLVRNARYWATPAANLSAVTYYFSAPGQELEDSLLAGEADLGVTPATPALYQQLQSVPGTAVVAVASDFYEDLDFNEHDPLLASAVVRRAMMLAVDRAAMASDALGPYGLPATPVEDRAYLPGEAGYDDDGASYDHSQAQQAASLLAQAGYHMVGPALRSPTGQQLSFTLSVPADDPLAAELAQQVAAACSTIGINVTVWRYGPSVGDLLASASPAGPPAGWQMALELRVVPNWPEALLRRYEAGSAEDVDGYSSPTMSSLAQPNDQGTGKQPPESTVANQVDSLAWSDAVDMPLVALPVLVVRDRGLLNVTTGPYFWQLVYDEQDWGFTR